MKLTTSNKVIIIAGLFMVVLFAILISINQILRKPAQPFGSGSVFITIEPGMNLTRVSEILEKEHLTEDAGKFRLAAKLMGAEKNIQPGKFLLPYGENNAVLIRFLLQPGISTTNVTIPEGLAYQEIAGILQAELEIDSTEFVKLCEDTSLLNELGIPAHTLEGYLFPDTYNFYQNSTSKDVLMRMTETFFDVFERNVLPHLDSIGLDMHEVITLASIIEGEVMVSSEAPTVSAVYHNRLKKRMLLAADPTIQYIIPDGPRRLLNRDLKIDSPYNTYMYRGLPPAPVNNPGRISLEAAVKPADVDYLYFVAAGDGTHAFNKTAAGHARDKSKFQKVRREVACKKRAGN